MNIILSSHIIIDTYRNRYHTFLYGNLYGCNLSTMKRAYLGSQECDYPDARTVPESEPITSGIWQEEIMTTLIDK